MSRTQLEAVRRMLRELSEMCENASLTGALSGGAAHATARYNRMLETLEAEAAVPPGMFSRLDEQSTGFGQLAVETRLLLASLKDEEDEEEGRHGRRGRRGLGALIGLAPFLDRDDLEKLVRERLEDSGPISDGLLIGLAPFLNKTMLREIVNRRVGVPAPPTPPEPPVPPAPPAPPAPGAAPAWEAPPAPGVPPPPAPEPFAAGLRGPVSEELSWLASRLADPGLTADERSRIAARLAELAGQG